MYNIVGTDLSSHNELHLQKLNFILQIVSNKDVFESPFPYIKKCVY